MNKVLLTVTTILIAISGYSQITISEGDMPVPGDTIRISNNLEFLSDPAETGTNHIWDYENLEAVDQYIDSFISPADAPLVHSLVFNLPWDTDKATVSLMQDGIGELTTGISMEDYYDFYANDETSFRHVGFGASISGVPMPVKFDSPDILYIYPLNYLDTFSSVTEYEVSLPTIGFFGEKIERSNTVDGWGTLILPMGSFEVLRVMSEVIRTDTIYYEAMGIGLSLPPTTTIEYKWVGIGMGEPLLQINNSAMTNTILYQDIATPDTSSQFITRVDISDNYNIYPNPTNGILNIRDKTKRTGFIDVEIVDTSGRLISVLSDLEMNNTDKTININCTNLNLYTGQYYIRIISKEGVVTKSFNYVSGN